MAYMTCKYCIVRLFLGFGKLKKCYVGANDVWNNPTTLTKFDQAEVSITFITKNIRLSMSYKKITVSK